MFGFLRHTPDTPARAPLPREIGVAGRTIALDVARTPRATRLTLRIGRDGASARITAPAHTRESEIAAFLARHMGWLEGRIAAYPDRPLLRPGVKVPLGGVPHRIVHRPGRGVTGVHAGEDGPEIHVHGAPEAAGRRVADFLKREARRVIEPMAHALAARSGRRIRTIRYKDTASRWGSCSAQASLSFSWRIMMAPPKIVAYLVAHEVAHLSEMNHGPKFWALCGELCPQTEECRAWLKRNGAKLQSIGFGA